MTRSNSKRDGRSRDGNSMDACGTGYEARMEATLVQLAWSKAGQVNGHQTDVNSSRLGMRWSAESDTPIDICSLDSVEGVCATYDSLPRHNTTDSAGISS